METHFLIIFVLPFLQYISVFPNSHPISISFKPVGFFLFQVPTKEQVDALSKELLARSTVPGIFSTLLATCVIVLTN